MARLVQHESSGPKEVKIGQESKWMCMCGLSINKPFCDGSHKLCSNEKEDKIYKYENGKRIEVKNI